MNKQETYNKIYEQIKKISQRSYITYNGGVGGDEYLAVIYTSDDKLSALRREVRSGTLRGLRDKVDLFLDREETDC
jgi:hypothetical protein